MRPEEEEPKVDKSLLTEGQKRELAKKTLTWKWLLFWGIVLALIVVCVIVIVLL